jgi:hypothetical protein
MRKTIGKKTVKSLERKTIMKTKEETKSDLTWLSLRIEEDVLAALKELAEKDTRTVSSLVRIVLGNYVKNNPKP